MDLKRKEKEKLGGAAKGQFFWWGVLIQRCFGPFSGEWRRKKREFSIFVIFYKRKKKKEKRKFQLFCVAFFVCLWTFFPPFLSVYLIKQSKYEEQ